ncbi:uncharacterized protein LOC130358335 [Hyla sarda]|uniref:uncharacterized protein LOC130358335 n=1 Tax=Hyla sarda TaxID=327740 RepID=UPI0024C25121|nr:uncharacterized protein LOC130358335 [Hyla sarda]
MEAGHVTTSRSCDLRSEVSQLSRTCAVECSSSLRSHACLAERKMPGCIVTGCTPRCREGEPDFVLHAFPKEKERIRTWLCTTGQEFHNLDELVDKIYDSKSNAFRLCSLHFTPSSYIFNPKTGRRRLSPIAVPTIFVKREEGEGPIPPNKRKRLAEDGASSRRVNPGEICPTCCQLVPHITTTKPAQPPNLHPITTKPEQPPNLYPITTKPEEPPDFSPITTKPEQPPDFYPITTNPEQPHAMVRESGTSFDRSWATYSKAIQVTPKTFSVRTQCSRLVDRKRVVPKKTPTLPPLVYGPSSSGLSLEPQMYYPTKKKTIVTSGRSSVTKPDD